MKKILINLTSSLFTVIFSLNANAIPLKEGYQPANKAANSATKLEEKEPEDLVKDENLKKDAQFSCLKFAAMRLGNEMSLRVTQIKPPRISDDPQYWIVVGNKINQDDEERPVSFSCKMTPSDSFLWNLEDFQIFQVSKEAVDQLKKIPMQDQ